MIPLKLETLLEGRVVESDRVEYKHGWNPSEVITTICAYANDFSNTNGGYIVVGIAESYGLPVLPPVGLNEAALDKIQQELFQYCNLITPRYTPQTEVIQYQGKFVLYLWCTAGDDGPYSAPKDVSSKEKHKEYWFKPSSVKSIARGSELSELFSKFNSVPFDDRINREATIDDIRRGYLEDFLVESNSSLKSDINKKPMEEMLLALEVANKTDIGIDIRNIGLLMFSDHPEKFLPGAQIEVVRFNSPDAEGSDDFTESIFKGSIQKQVRDALSYINATLIEEKVIKRPRRAEADRFFNYPYEALEEILVNSVLHKSYRIQEPVEIRIYVDCIKVINYPGPERSIKMETLIAGRAIARQNRNRRIGEFLKEIDLCERRSTGITKILNALKSNGSPPPEFETNNERDYMIVTIFQHERFASDKADNVSDNVINNVTDNVTDKIIENVTDKNIDEKVKNGVENKRKVRQMKLFELLKHDSSATVYILAKALNVSERTIHRDLDALRKDDRIGRLGSDTNGSWQVRDSLL